MGCKASKPDETQDIQHQIADAHSSTPAPSVSKQSEATRVSFLNSSNDNNEFRESLFASVGVAQVYKAGEVLIEEGRPSEAAIYIRKGSVSLRKAGSAKEVAKRFKGDIIGEMSFLLGETPGVSVIAEGLVEATLLEHSQLITMLNQDPGLAGRLFKMLATTLSERIAEASAKMRSEVVAKNTKKNDAKKNGSQAQSALNVPKYRALFGLGKDEGLLLRTTCSMRKEANALKDANVQFGDLYVFEQHLCFDWKVFGFHKQQVLSLLEVLALLKSNELPNTIEAPYSPPTLAAADSIASVQGKGYSYELTVPDNFEHVWNTMEMCRRNTNAAALQQASLDNSAQPGAAIYEEVDTQIEQPPAGSSSLSRSSTVAQAFHEETKGRRGSTDASSSQQFMDLTEEDWALFLSGAKQRRYRKGDYVLTEGMPTQALYQILHGDLRVELKLKDQPTAVVVGHRSAGEMFGETSLLKAGVATASIVTDSEEAILIYIDGAYLEDLFTSNPKLPGRFFAYLASYQARRLQQTTAMLAKSTHEVTGSNTSKVMIEDIFSNPAYMGIFRKFMFRAAEDDPENREAYAMSLAMFEFWMDVQDYKSEPNPNEMVALGKRILDNFIEDGAKMYITYFDDAMRTRLKERCAHETNLSAARRIFDEAQLAAVRGMESQCYGQFLASEHFAYILELKSKEGYVPGLSDFRLIRVLGQGGFGQVLEVVKRDCGKRYAMKVMHKEMMRRCLGSQWRKKIWLEKDLMASLSHPMLVNLLYAFQNQEFLVLVMDLVPAGDLSEFVLTKKRLTADQVRFVVMEVVCVLAYCHTQNVLYRDLKPENLLIDEQGHVRLIDMGLAARISKKQPRRRSRVGTDCYMAPEVRWAKERREPYGISCDWYTVGVLTYEFSAGAVPFAHPEQDPPVYRQHDFSDPHCESLVKGLLDQDHRSRLGCGPQGVQEIFDHPYWRGVEWDLVPLKKFESPCKGLKGPPKRKKEKEHQAVQIANDISEAEREGPDTEYSVSNWDFVSPNAVIEEYMENIYQCVSSI